LAVFGGIAGYAYDWGESQFETPDILADSGPIKSQPESPDGLNVPNQDVAGLNDGAPDPANPQVERLLPPPETPLPPQTESVEAEAITDPEALAPAGPAPQIAASPPATAPDGPYVVQLAALKSQDGARPAWGRLQKAHPALLSERELAIQEIDLGERGIFYRVQAGYFPDRASALELCTALKARGQDCLVVKR